LKNTAKALGLREVRVVVSADSEMAAGDEGPGLDGTVSGTQWIEELILTSKNSAWQPVEDDPQLSNHGFRLAFPLRRDDRTVGLLLVDGPGGS
jgi:hypothetical protein